jgi:hypothetical protein
MAAAVGECGPTRDDGRTRPAAPPQNDFTQIRFSRDAPPGDA